MIRPSKCLAATGAALALLAAGCSANPDAGGSRDTMKIVLTPPSTGPYVQFGEEGVKAWQFAADKVNKAGGIAGAQIEIVKADSDFTPAGTVRAVQQAVASSGAKYVGEILGSQNVAAVSQQLKSLGIVMIDPFSQDDALRGASCAANAFHTAQSLTMLNGGVVSTIKDVPGRKWAIIASDYSSGHTAAANFKDALIASGREVVSEQFAPQGTTDYGAYISKIKASGANALFNAVFAQDSVPLINQIYQFGLNDQLKGVTGSGYVTADTFAPLGDKINGYYSVIVSNPAADTDLNREFVDGFTKKYGAAPTDWAFQAYLGAEALFAAALKADSIDPNIVRDTLSGMTFDSILGQVTMRPEDHQLLAPVFVGKVDASSGESRWKITGSVPAKETTPVASAACKF